MHISSDYQLIAFYFLPSSLVGQSPINAPLPPSVLTPHTTRCWSKTTLYVIISYGCKLAVKKWSTEKEHKVCVCSGAVQWGDRERSRTRWDDKTMEQVRVALRWKVSKDLGIWERPLQFQAVSEAPDLILQCVYSCDIYSYTKILKARLIKQKQLRASLIYKSIAKSNQIPTVAGKHSS